VFGLPAVHGTVRAHGGAIAITTAPGVGTTFELYLPAMLAASVAEAPERPSAPLVVLSPMHARVLLADDEALARTATAAMLESLGCEVRAVDNGAALIAALAEGELPDLIVSDLAMPGLAGIGLVQALDALRPGCPLLLITGFSGEDVSAACTPRLNRRLLRKPFQRADLQKQLRELLPGTPRSESMIRASAANDQAALTKRA
jgi:CheY-like chemotaxis protein